MKKLIFLLFFLPALVNAQIAIYPYVGTTTVKGNAGIGIEAFNRISIAAGWKCDRVFNTGWFQSYSLVADYYFPFKEAICYVQVGGNTKGVCHRATIWEEYEPVPSANFILGTRFYPNTPCPNVTDRLSFDIGIGFTQTKYATDFVIDFSIQFVLIRL